MRGERGLWVVNGYRGSRGVRGARGVRGVRGISGMMSIYRCEGSEGFIVVRGD